MEEQLSKSQLKKQAKRARIQAKYNAKKKTKINASQVVAHVWGPRQERNAMTRADFESNCERGPIIVIDCEWDDRMSDKERLSLTQQIMYSYAINRKASKPVRLCLFGVSKRQKQLLCKLPGFKSWYIGMSELPFVSISDIRKDGIYLTADTENVLDISQVNRQTSLIIGGIVDRNRYKNATVEKADSLGIGAAQLPIRELMAMKSSKVLTVNHVFEIITEVLYHNNWSLALKRVIPDRKKNELV